MTRRADEQDDRALARELFRRAEGLDDPEIGPLVSAVPALLAEAGRRRRLDAEPASRLVAAAVAWLPRLAVATALLALAALAWPGASSHATAGDETGVLDAWLVTGRVSGSVSDPALDALLQQGTP